MLLIKAGFPDEGELVLCTVTNVQHNSVFCKLDEYDKAGMIHISEVSPGRIRNIRDFVVEGKKIVCLVLRVNKEKGYIDLSLRRVNENQKRIKISEIKQEQTAEKIIEFVAKKENIDFNGLYNKIKEGASGKYDLLHDCFVDVAAEKFSLENIDIPKKAAKELADVIRQRVRKEEVEIKGELKLISYAPNGVEIIKEALMRAEEAGKEKTSISYCGGGKYKVVVKDDNFKSAEKLTEKLTGAAIKVVESHEGEGEFLRAK